MKAKVLIIDDSAIVRQQVTWALMQADFEVIEAVDGEDGASKIASTPDLKMVLCDVNMPRLSGIDLLERLSANGGPPCPFVMLTTEGHPELIARAKTLGAKGWVVKPVKPELLVATVTKLAGV